MVGREVFPAAPHINVSTCICTLINPDKRHVNPTRVTTERCGGGIVRGLTSRGGQRGGEGGGARYPPISTAQGGPGGRADPPPPPSSSPPAPGLR